MYFIPKCQIPEFLEPPTFTRICPPPISGCNPKLKNPACRLLLGLLKGFQNGKSQPHSTKTHKEDRIIGNGLLPDQGPGGGPHGDRHLTEQYNFCPVLTVKIWKRVNLTVESYSIHAFVQAHRQTFCIPIGRGKIFYAWKFIPFHFTMFICFLRSLIHSICEGWEKRRWCTLDLNPRLQDCRCRWIHWTMAAPQLQGWLRHNFNLKIFLVYRASILGNCNSIIDSMGTINRIALLINGPFHSFQLSKSSFEMWIMKCRSVCLFVPTLSISLSVLQKDFRCKLLPRCTEKICRWWEKATKLVRSILADWDLPWRTLLAGDEQPYRLHGKSS